MTNNAKKKPRRVFSAFGSLDKKARNWKYLPNVRQSSGSSPRGEELVYRMNETTLEVGQGASSFRGYLGLPMGVGAMVLLASMIGLLGIGLTIGGQGFEKEIGWPLAIFLLLSVLIIGIPLELFAISAAVNDFFGYVDAPLRFDRSRRKIYIWANRKGGAQPLELDWDEIKPVAQSASAPPYQFNAFQSVLLVDEDANGDVRFEEKLPRIGQIGAAVLDRQHTLAAYEFVRVFMEQGPQALPPVKEHLTWRVGPRSFVDIFGLIKGTMRDWPQRPQHERQRTRGWLIAGVVAMTVFAPVMLPLQLAQGIALRTTRIPIWPENYERMAAEGGPLLPPPGSVPNEAPMLLHEKLIAALWLGSALVVYALIARAWIH